MNNMTETNYTFNGKTVYVKDETETVLDGEEYIFSQLLDLYPQGILSVVIDSYDYMNFIKMSGNYKDKIINRNGKVVFRPDSGDPIAVTLDVINELNTIFGHTVNSKGYKQLYSKVGVLWGDGIDYQGIRNILFALKNAGWSSSNIVFGMGGALLQKVNRDIQRFAFKSSAQCRDGKWYNVNKKPVDTTKVSKAGKMKLVKFDNYTTITWDHANYEVLTDELETVFENGELIKEYSFDEVRKNTRL